MTFLICCLKISKNKEVELKDEIYNNILELTETGDEYYTEDELSKIVFVYEYIK